MDISNDIELAGLQEPATVTQLAKFLRTGDDTPRAAIARGELGAVRINGRGDIRIFHAQIRRWLKARLTTA